MLASGRDTTLLSVTENGYGKRTGIENYRLTHRDTQGVSNIRTSERNGPVVSIHAVSDEDELMIITTNGLIIRLPVRDLRPIGRNTQGVRLINLGEGDRVIDVSRITPNGEGDDPALNGEGDDPTPSETAGPSGETDEKP